MAPATEGQQAAALASLRAHLTAASQAGSSAPAQEYDDDILRSLLAVEDWNVSRAVALFKQVNGDPSGSSSGATGPADQAGPARPSVEDDAATARRLQQMEIDDSQVGVASGETLRAEQTPLWPGRSNQQLYRRSNRGAVSYGGTGGPFGHGDDRLQAPGRNNAVTGAGAGGGSGGGWPSILTILYQTLTLPFSLAQGLLFFILRLLRIRPPGSGGAGGGSGFGLGTSRFHPSAGTRMTIDARAAAERYIQELEQDLAGDEGSSSSSGAAATQSRPSLVYPPLFVGSYSQACQRAKEELKILAIILTSVDNPDSDTFRRHTLTDSALAELLSGSDFLVWAGDIREREAWQVADICDATSFPFVAFVSLQPSRGGGSLSRSSSSSSSLSTPRLAILSRHSGQSLVKPTPSSAAAQLTEHLSGLLLPRVQPYLARLRSERARLASERALRAEQDAAFERAAQADVARVQARREAERQRVEEENRQRDEAARVEEQRRKVLHWRIWARANLVPAEPLAAAEHDILVQFRLPGGRSLQRSFRLDDDLEGIFAYVETAAVGLPEESESEEAQTMARSHPSAYEHQYTFDLFLSGYPRKRVSPAEIVGGSGKTRIREVAGLNDVRRANVIVEGTIAGASGSNTRTGPGAESVEDSSGEESD